MDTNYIELLIYDKALSISALAEKYKKGVISQDQLYEKVKYIMRKTLIQEINKSQMLREALIRNQIRIESGRVWTGTKWHYPILGMDTTYHENEVALSAIDRIIGSYTDR